MNLFTSDCYVVQLLKLLIFINEEGTSMTAYAVKQTTGICFLYGWLSLKVPIERAKRDWQSWTEQSLEN